RGKNVPLIHASVDPEKVGRNTPVTVGMVGDINLVAQSVIEAIRSIASPSQLRKASEERRLKLAAYSASRLSAVRESGRLSKGDPVPWQRVMYELNEFMEPDAVVVEELGRAARTLTHIEFRNNGRLKIGRTT